MEKRVCLNRVGLFVGCILLGEVQLCEAVKLVLPKDGAVYEVGQKIIIRVEPEQGETLVSMLTGDFDEVGPNKDGILEYIYEIPKNAVLGTHTSGSIAAVYFRDHSGELKEVDFSPKITYVLPPTTVLRSIGASIDGRKESFLVLYKHENGKLILTSDSFTEVIARGLYSDGVARDIVAHPDTTYISSNEKVVKVTPPGKWTLNDKSPTLAKKAEKEKHGDAALVTAVGPGTAEIIVRNGPHETKVTAVVNVRPCSEWKNLAFKFELPVCD